MNDRQLIEDLLSALEYHTEQTRPIQFSRVAIEAAREHLRKPAQQEPLIPFRHGCKWCGKTNGCEHEEPKIGCVNHDCDKCKAQQDLPDLIAGALGVSRGTAYDMMREALAEAPPPDPCCWPGTSCDAQQEPVLWQILNGVCHAGVRSTENLAKEAAEGMQKTHDLGGSLAAFHVRPLYTAHGITSGKATTKGNK